jgi:arylsulfatase A-like enzyme
VWSFEKPAGAGTSPLGWSALQGVDDLTVRDGRLVGRTTERAVLAVSISSETFPGDVFHALEVRMRVSAGSSLGATLMPGHQLPRNAILFERQMSPLAGFNVGLSPGERLETYVLTAEHALFETSYPMAAVNHLVLWPTDAPDAEFEIASVRLISRREHLLSVPWGVGRHDLSGEVMEGFASRVQERVTFDVLVPSGAYLDLAIGTLESGPVTFRIERDTSEGAQELFGNTITTPGSWERAAVDLAPFGGMSIGLSFVLESEQPGALGLWGAPVIRSRSARPPVQQASPARDALLGKGREAPQGVILIIADTLRRDHLPFHGYERPTAPEITRLAAEGATFLDAIAQGPWTKVSVPSILSSLYPTTHGLRDMPDRLSSSVTTLAEVYRDAGYATFATSSVPFTGRLSNLQQGFEVLLESSSLPPLEPSASKTADFFVDRLVSWIETHHDIPFFALLHVFDPHSPFEPASPYASLWMTGEEAAAHRDDMARVRPEIEDPLLRWHALPTRGELDRVGIDPATYVAREKAWYDASIRAMDTEIGHLRERLEALGLGRSTLIALTSDHGEEFLEHDRHFHGYTAYGEMLNVPLFFWWPDAIPPGIQVPQTVQTIDLMPTLLDISGLPIPAQAQGQSLVPHFMEEDPAHLGWQPRPAFAERVPAPAEFGVYETDLESRTIIHDGWKLIHHLAGPEGTPETFELYRHDDDPLNTRDLSSENPDVAHRLRAMLEDWHQQALADRYEPESGSLSPEERERLRSLGYLQ